MGSRRRLDCGSIDVYGVGARPVRKPLVHVDDRTHERELGAKEPVGLLRCAEAMGAHERVPPVHAVDRIVFCVSGMEEPQHALESPRRVGRSREFPRYSSYLVNPSTVWMVKYVVTPIAS